TIPRITSRVGCLQKMSTCNRRVQGDTEMNIFDKKVAVVTGASSGIGRETVLSLIKAGYQVHAGARRLDAMRELENAGAYLHHVDLTNPENIDAFVAGVLRLGGRVDVLVNNAGYGAYGAVEDIPLSAAREQMEVNLFALAHLIKAVLPTMRKQRSGRIINVSSIGGKLWSPLGGWYHASKFAVEGLSDALRNELRPFGIDVIVIEPGGVKTEWTSIMLDNRLRVGVSKHAHALTTLSRRISIKWSKHPS